MDQYDFCVFIICMQTTIKIQAAAPGYFDNPQTIYNEFKGKNCGYII